MKKILLYTVLTTFALTSCNKEGIDTYELNDNRIYFQEQTFTGSDGSAGYGTSTTFSFVGYGSDFTSYVFGGTVKVMGEIKDYDRPIKVVVDEENTTMVQGEGYEINLDTICVKAGTNSCKVNVRILRPERLRTQEDTLTLKLLPNDHFGILKTYKSSNNWQNTAAKDIDGTRYSFRISEKYSQPGAWTGNGVFAYRYFGNWTITKFIYINNLFKFTKNDWENANHASSKITAGTITFYARELQKELQAQADAGKPVLDEDGNPMQLPSPYEVDYNNLGQQ